MCAPAAPASPLSVGHQQCSLATRWELLVFTSVQVSSRSPDDEQQSIHRPAPAFSLKVLRKSIFCHCILE